MPRGTKEEEEEGNKEGEQDEEEGDETGGKEEEEDDEEDVSGADGTDGWPDTRLVDSGTVGTLTLICLICPLVPAGDSCISFAGDGGALFGFLSGDVGGVRLRAPADTTVVRFTVDEELGGVWTITGV